MGHDELLQVLKEKMRLEGQLESLSSEANQVFSTSSAPVVCRWHLVIHACLFQCQQGLCSMIDHTDLLSSRL